MFERPTTEASVDYAPGFPATGLPSGRFPLDLELEFAEMRAAAPAGRAWPLLLTSGVLFQVILIVEFQSRLLAGFDFGVRGVCAMLVLVAAAFSLAGGRAGGRQPAWIMLCCTLLTAALAGGIAFATLNELFLVQTGIALLLLSAGWGAVPHRRWAVLGAIGVLSVDAACLLLGPSPGWLGAIRAAFDLGFRAAWDAAAEQRKPVALLFFSIDALADHKRERGFRFVETLQRQVAGLLQEGLRESGDMVARFDHMHFVVMLPGVGRDGTTQIAERLRGSVEAMAVYAGPARHSATVTVGAASMRARRGIPRENLVEAAVQSLEQARAYGPNTVCVEGVGCVPRMS
jgi:diguanylate cyclase (GGDEF)-like protein